MSTGCPGLACAAIWNIPQVELGGSCLLGKTMADPGWERLFSPRVCAVCVCVCARTHTHTHTYLCLERWGESCATSPCLIVRVMSLIQAGQAFLPSSRRWKVSFGLKSVQNGWRSSGPIRSDGQQLSWPTSAAFRARRAYLDRDQVLGLLLRLPPPFFF